MLKITNVKWSVKSTRPSEFRDGEGKGVEVHDFRGIDGESQVDTPLKDDDFLWRQGA